MTEETTIPVPSKLLSELRTITDSCRDLAFQLKKDYIYNKCVETQKLLDEVYQKYFDSLPNKEELDNLEWNV